MTSTSTHHQNDIKDRGEEEDEEDFGKSAELLEELRCLVELLDHELRPCFDPWRSIQIGSARKIAFADI